MTSSYRTINNFHIVFDSYIEGSLKGLERKSRTKSGAIHLARKNENTPVLEQMKQFWNSERNKIIIQNFSIKYLAKLAMETGVNITFSGVIDNDTCTAGNYVDGQSKTSTRIPELALNLEEADMRIIPHIVWHLQRFKDSSEIIVESNDTDVVILLLFYIENFKQYGLEKLWIHFGKQKTKSYIPLHEIYEKFGADYCRSLLKCHIGTGCDYLSKVGTKKSAINAEPNKNL